MSVKKINAAIQVLPKVVPEKVYPVIDKAIEIIQNSGLHYTVCPFETVVEGEYDKVMDLLKAIQETCFKEGAEELLINIKLQIGNDKNILISDKTGKYE